MKLLITGANGQLGTTLQEMLSRGYADLGDIPACYRLATVIPTDADTLDITDEAAVMRFFEETRPDVVIHAAAYTQVDACEQNEETAVRVNADGARHIAKGAAAVGATLVHVSTDYVFDGKGNTPYREDDTPSPATVYGRSKYEGEKAVLAACDKAFVARTAWLYSENGGNFLKTMLRLADSRDHVTVVADQVGSPTYAEDLAWTLLWLSTTDRYGIYHVTGGGSCSWCDFATAIMKTAGLSCRVFPCTTAEYPSPTPRPAYSVLGHTALAAAGLDKMRPWEQALAACIRKMKARQQEKGGKLWEI